MYCASLLFLMKDIFPPVQAPSTYFRWFPASVRTVLCVLSLSVTNPFFCLPASYPILSISNYIMFFTFQVNLYIYNDIFHLVPAILPAGELFLYHHVSLKSYSTSKGKQHDIVSISRCLHLEHLLLFCFFVFVFLYCTKCIYKSFKSFSLNLHTVSVPQQIFCIWIFAYQFMKLSFSNTKICRRFINR